MSERYSLHEFFNIIACEGIDYGIHHYCSPDRFPPQILAEAIAYIDSRKRLEFKMKELGFDEDAYE